MAENDKKEGSDIQSKIRASQVERQSSQKKTFTRWINAKLSQAPDSPAIDDLFVDLRDGNNLLTLLEVLTNTKLKRVKGRLRLHHLNNLNLALDVLNQYHVKLVNISNTDIVDGDRIPTMGLVWSIIYKFQIQAALAYASKTQIPGHENENNNVGARVQKQGEAEDKLLQWCQYVTAGYKGVDIQNFTTSWTDGLAFNALLHSYRPDLFDYDKLLDNDTKTNLDHAFNIAQEKIGVTKLLEPSDLQRGRPDSRTVVMYLSTIYENFRDMVPHKEIVGEDEVEGAMAPQFEVDEYTTSLQGQIAALQKLLDSPAMADKPLPSVIKELLEMHIAFSAFLEDLQSHQVQVVQLVEQADDILSSDSLSRPDKGFLESDIQVLKETWESVFDKVTDKQDSISIALMKAILSLLESGSESLQKESTKLNAFQRDPSSLHDALEKYSFLKDYEEQISPLREDLHRTAEECNVALDAFEDDEKEDAVVKHKKFNDSLRKFEEDLNSTKLRLGNKLIYEYDKAKTLFNGKLDEAKSTVNDVDINSNERRPIQRQADLYETELDTLRRLKPEEDLLLQVLKDAREDATLSDLLLGNPGREEEQIKSKYARTQDELKSALARLKSRLDALDQTTKDEFQKWVNKFHSLQDWVTNVQSAIDGSSPLSKDKQLLDNEKKKVEEYMADLEAKVDGYRVLSADLHDNILPKQLIPEDNPDIVAFKELERKMNDLNRKCLKRQESLQGYFRVVSSDQKEQFRQWQRKKKDLEHKLSDIKENTPPNVADKTTVDELEGLDKAYEVLIKALENFKGDVDNFASFGQNLAAKELVDEDDAKVVNRDIKEVEENYNTVLQNYISERRKNQGILLGLQHAERELIDEWYQRLDSVTGQVSTMDDKLGSFSDVNETNVELVESALKEDLQQLEVKVDNTTSFGEQLCRSPRLSNSRKSHISHDVLTIQSQWLKVKERGGELQFAVQGELTKSQKLSQWKHSVDEITSWITAKEKVISTHEAATEYDALFKAENVLDQLSSELADYQQKIDNLTEAGQVLTRLFGPADKSTAMIRTDVATVENKWDFLKERCSAAILNVASEISLLRGKEDDKVREWDAKSAKVEEWLDVAEDKASLFNQPADDLIILEEQVSKHEELVFRLATEEKETDEILDWCNNVITEEQIMDPDKRDRVREQLRLLRKRKNKLNMKLMAQQDSLSSKLDELLAIEAEEMDSWLASCRKIDKELDALLGSSEFPPAVSAKEAIENVSQLKELCFGIEDLRTHIDKLSKQARTLTKERKLGRQKSDDAKTEAKRLVSKWEELHKLMSERLAKAEDELLSFKQEWKGQLSGWQTHSQVLSDWIHEMNKRLQESGKRDYTDMPFEEVVGFEKKLQDINRHVQAKGEDLNDVLGEGNSMAVGESTQVDDADTRKEIQSTIHKLKEDWDDLLSSLDIEMKRLHDHLYKRFSNTLSERLEEIDNLEVKSKALPAVQNNSNSIRQGAEKVAEFMNQLNRLKPRVKVLQQYCEEILGTDLFTTKEQAEIENSTGLLEESFSKLLNYAEDKRNNVQDLAVQKIRDETTRIVSELELVGEKQLIIHQHDKKSSHDVKKLLAAQESLVDALGSISNDLADLDTLCQELDGFAVLPESEKGEILEKMDSLTENSLQASEKGAAEKENLYNTLIRLLKGRISDLSTTLDNITNKISNIPEDSADLYEALEEFRSIEDTIEELDLTHKDAEKLTLDINDVIGENVLRKDDQLILKEENSKIVNRLVEVSDLAMGKNKSFRKLIKAMMKEHIEALWEWVRSTQQQKLNDTSIGPEVNTVKEQIKHIKDLQTESQKIQLPVSYNDPLSEEILDTVTRSSMMEAEREWTVINDWLKARLAALEEAKNAWAEFRQKEIELLDFLRAKEELIKRWQPIDLEKEESVKKRMDELKQMNGEMEVRKNLVGDLHNSSTRLIDMIGSKSPTVNNIKSQVADIHDCWNGIVKQILETSSKLNMAQAKLKNLEEGIKEVKMWLDETQTVLNFYTDSATDDVVEDLIPQLERKCSEEPLKRCALEKVNSIGSELIDDVDGISHDVLESNINNLNKEWDVVTSELQVKRKKKRKGPCCFWCWRRLFLKYGYYS